ncbi:Ubiquitin-like modifier-activating enzyme 1 [Tritrichomonas foetus]|uniref:E1 ubiquitin-activating enzyme n=1 Tax=Tritrichomonas foetus TaxID=1144522 RepID=A0A1J4KYM3_9EUKA|nr:Ubiquitin-like modifier-activating enzyme 1 [Tritrichomonas foetus]|eukprot:OHT15976.1 Ubiquitin-like modifier-activating enzyme 1 [Tritrichomonas foetus]
MMNQANTQNSTHTTYHKEESEIDQKLYSRQIYTIGLDAMKKLTSSSVLISGMGGLGVEIAKNIILAGVKSVTVHDTKMTTIMDLASNFYLNENSIGKNRALESYIQLTQLNNYVTVNASTDELTERFISNFNCIVLTDSYKFSEIQRISIICHSHNIKLIITETRGVFGYIFDDFGNDFIVSDPTGETPSRFLISFITKSKDGVVTIQDGETHNLSDGDHVRFEEVQGMIELNDKEFPVKVINNRQFSIGDTSSFGEYSNIHRVGYGNQVILPITLNFREYSEALKYSSDTMNLPFDYCCLGRDQQVILAFVTEQYCLEKNQNDFISVAKEVNEIYHIVDEIDENLLQEFIREEGAVISPSCATIGGIAGQEVIKSISGKFTPLTQFLGMGYLESIPSNHEYSLCNDRYDPYRIVFGNQQQEVMQNLKYFMVGAGAIGCEQLKNWALMGVATKENGHIYITDMDAIEKSNLNRQFLFRSSDIGKMKSDIAAQVARKINPSLKIESHQNKIGEETESYYNEEFYEKLSGVCNALDNVESRRYTDRKCTFFNKPLLESGTLGKKAHFQIVIPNLTEAYSDQTDPENDNIAVCTLHNYPSNINHTCAWGREKFHELFEKKPQLARKLLTEPDYIKQFDDSLSNDLTETIEAATKLLVSEKCVIFNDCIKWARNLFESFFNIEIRKLQTNFPEDYINPTNGLPFWSEGKRFPRVLTYDPTNEYHANFITSAAILQAKVCGIVISHPIKDIPLIAQKYTGKEFNFMKENTNEAPISNYDQLLNSIRPFIGKPTKITPEVFEKDDDTNYHMEFISAAANLRAINYYIEPQNKLEITRIAGKIIPAIATTTAMICGLVALEMYKVHSIDDEKRNDLSTFRFGSINVAIPLFNITEPGKCKNKICEISGDITFNELFNHIKQLYQANILMLSAGKNMIYSVYNKNHQKILSEKIKDHLIKEFKMEPNVKVLELVPFGEDDEGNDADIPTIKLRIC